MKIGKFQVGDNEELISMKRLLLSNQAGTFDECPKCGGSTTKQRPEIQGLDAFEALLAKALTIAGEQL